MTSPQPNAHRRAEHGPTPYVDLTRQEWSALRDKTPLPLTAEEVERLRGLGDVIDLDEVRDVYLPLSRLLNLYVQATGELRGALNTFLGEAGNGHGAQRGVAAVDRRRSGAAIGAIDPGSHRHRLHLAAPAPGLGAFFCCSATSFGSR